MLPVGRGEDPAAGKDPGPAAADLFTGIFDELRNLLLCFGIVVLATCEEAPAEGSAVRTTQSAIKIARPRRRRDQASRIAPSGRERGRQ